MSYTTAVIVSNRINAYLRSDELPEISETLYTVTCYSIGYSIAAIYVAVRFVWQAMQPTFDYDIDNTPATPDLEYTVSLEPLAVGCAPPTQVQPRITVVVDATDVVAPTPTTPTTPTRRRTYSTAHVATVAAFLDALPSR